MAQTNDLQTAEVGWIINITTDGRKRSFRITDYGRMSLYDAVLGYRFESCSRYRIGAQFLLVEVPFEPAGISTDGDGLGIYGGVAHIAVPEVPGRR